MRCAVSAGSWHSQASTSVTSDYAGHGGLCDRRCVLLRLSRICATALGVVLPVLAHR